MSVLEKNKETISICMLQRNSTSNCKADSAVTEKLIIYAFCCANVFFFSKTYVMRLSSSPFSCSLCSAIELGWPQKIMRSVVKQRVRKRGKTK